MAFPLTYPTPGQVVAKQLKAFGQSPRQRHAIRAWRYYEGTVYDPTYGTSYPHPFTDWDETEKGRRPAVQPLPQRIVEMGSQFLFAVPPRFTVGDPETAQGEALQKLLDDTLIANRLHQRYLPEARACGVEGATVFKFAWDPLNKRRPVSIQTFSPWEVSFEYAEMDSEVVVSATIQIKYLHDDEWWLYREYWDSEVFRVYKKLKASADNDMIALDGFERAEWPFTEKPNPFGVIPLTQVVNQKRKHDPDGRGDYWSENIYHLLDDYNLFCWLERNSNQVDGNPIFVILNDADYTGSYAPAPGTGIKVVGEGADAKYIVPDNNIREWIDKSKQDLKKQIFDAVGYDDLDVETITNKGNLTRAVWELMFHKSIKSTDEKRAHWGEGGLCVFFESMLEGLSRLPDAVRLYPALKAVKPDDLETYDVQAVWPDLFNVTQEELTMIVTNATTSIASGFLTRERAVPIVAKGWGIQDVTALEKELEDAHELLDTIDKANADMVVNEAANAGKPDTPAK